MKLLLAVFLVIAGLGAFLNAEKLTLVQTIGDERENYTFFVITSAAFSDNGDMFVLDGQGVFIAKYDRNGKFIERVGRSGQGPMDFYFPRSVIVRDKHLYVLDRGNHRIAQMDLDFKNLKYYKMSSGDHLEGSLCVAKENRFIGEFFLMRPNGDKIGIIDSNGDVLETFFDKFPTELHKSFFEKKHKNPMTSPQHFLVSKEAAPLIAGDDNGERLLVSFKEPDNPVRFYVYTTGGKMLREFSYTIEDSRYKFNDFFIKASPSEFMNPKKYPAEIFSPYIYSMFIHNDRFIVFLWLQDYQKKEREKNRTFCLIFDSKGKKLSEFQVEDDMRFFCISREGLLLASKSDERITKLYVYKLNQ